MKNENVSASGASRPSTRSSALRYALGGLTAAASLVAVLSNQAPQKVSHIPTEAKARAAIYSCIDTSKSNRSAVPTAALELGKLTLQLDSDTWDTVLRGDSELRELYSGFTPASGEELLNDIIPGLVPDSGHDNTYLDLVWSELVHRTKERTGPSVITLATDGACEGMTAASHRKVTRCAQELANDPKVLAVFVEGVDPTNVARMRSDLLPLARKIQFVANGSLDLDLIARLTASGTVR